MLSFILISKRVKHFFYSYQILKKGCDWLATKKDLQNEVNRLNNKYCRNTKNHLRISQAYGGYSVELVGKRNKRTGKLLKGAMSGAGSIGNDYHDTATKTLNSLYRADSRGWVKSSIRSHEPKRVKRKY